MALFVAYVGSNFIGMKKSGKTLPNRSSMGIMLNQISLHDWFLVFRCFQADYRSRLLYIDVVDRVDKAANKSKADAQT